MSASIVSWICGELSRLLGFEASEDIAKYILAIESPSDLEEYMYDLLDRDVPRNRKFVTELLKRWKPANKAGDVPNDVQVYKKTDNDQEYIQAKTEPSNAKVKKKKQQKSQTGMKQHEEQAPKVENFPGEFNEDKLSRKEASEPKKKQKFVSLYSKEGQARATVILPGKHMCDCQALKHSLVNNCLKCGRIVCAQEGSGPCLFCGALVCTKDEQEVLARGSKKSEKLRQHLLNKRSKETDDDDRIDIAAKVASAYEKAVEQKNRLLEYDKNSVRRTQVIDDQSDYYATDSNRWLSDAEREKLRKREEELRQQRHGSRRDRKITFDFAGRRIIEEDGHVNMYDVNDEVVQEVTFGNKPNQKQTFSNEDFGDLVNPLIRQPAPKFIPMQNSSANKQSNVSNNSNKLTPDVDKKVRIQDREYQEMADEGMCMSMHQPWASLLVKGIKIHEGRSWYTPHRGKLWIAATAKEIPPEEIAEVEHAHRLFNKNDPNLEFPKEYPTACLLGCVDVVDCLCQEEYREKFPDGESGSLYVFICENPQELVVKFPIKGKHKIYRLEGHIHQAAKKGLRRT